MKRKPKKDVRDRLSTPQFIQVASCIADKASAPTPEHQHTADVIPTVRLAIPGRCGSKVSQLDPYGIVRSSLTFG